LIPQAWHHVEQYANNPIEADHSQLKHRLRPMRGLQTNQTAQGRCCVKPSRDLDAADFPPEAEYRRQDSHQSPNTADNRIAFVPVF
jgi:hypothetical protein